jgi:hypothetical protein
MSKSYDRVEWTFVEIHQEWVSVMAKPPWKMTHFVRALGVPDLLP